MFQKKYLNLESSKFDIKHPCRGIALSKFSVERVFMKVDELWKKSLDILRDEINPNSFHLLFKDLKPVSLDGNELTILIENSFKKDAITTRFLDHISSALNESFGSKINLKIIGQLNKQSSVATKNNKGDLHKYTFSNSRL